MIDEAQALKAGGITIWTEGDVLVLKYSVWFYGFLGTKRIPRSSITSVTWKEPGDWLAGFMALDILGEKPPSPHASPNVQNQNRLQYERGDRDRFAALRDWIAAGRAPAASEVAASSSVADEIAKLGKLREQGLLTDEEFTAQKAKLLG
ncbi:Short C-terminal domain-containing protein [Sphingopyxis sp. YR583]|uniref:SHOCT domain-containing protein n=1 Tax=Sphingopyxis sp. YR583 TaxID=1881047 RepID=UPI0008A7D4EC|nr:SHOCT domain-containing protein [Sphingopyxis sp. YR583]SEH12739.1 Short C-terminal domain-containing protein [Sphingopyxis sp. YR583]